MFQCVCVRIVLRLDFVNCETIAKIVCLVDELVVSRVCVCVFESNSIHFNLSFSIIFLD